MISRRSAIIAGFLLVVVIAITQYWTLIPGASDGLSYLHVPLGTGKPESTTTVPPPKNPPFEAPKPESTATMTSSIANPSPAPTSAADNYPIDAKSVLSKEVQIYFDQVFSYANPPPQFDYPELRLTCEHTTWKPDVYLKCGGMSAGMTTIMSQIKTCFKMAVEGGVGLLLPSMPLRSSTNLQEFNFLNPDAYLDYEEWFDAEHLIEVMGRTCPKLKVVHPKQIKDGSVVVKDDWNIDIGKAPGYVQFNSYFWAGRPFKPYFDEEVDKLQGVASMIPNHKEKPGISVITMGSQFLIFKVMDDPTGHDRRLWSDLGMLIRFKEEPREIVHRLLAEMERPYYGVHFRVENDTIWSSLENQLTVDLDALDLAWAKYGSPGAQKPLVYLACGDEGQVEKFVAAGKPRGWDVTHKWKLAKDAKDTKGLEMINNLAFDFMGAVDMGIMVKSEFFMGVIGSAFSSTIANARDVTGRYRGSSFVVIDEGNARNHLFNDHDAGGYACCL
jgi:hypothetical protein